jgi:hypothetical protein
LSAMQRQTTRGQDEANRPWLGKRVILDIVYAIPFG